MQKETECSLLREILLLTFTLWSEKDVTHRTLADEIMNAYPSSIVKAEVVERRFFGKPVQAIKVYCKVATETVKLAKQLRELEGVKDCLEDDIRVSMRYLIDNNLAPCIWHEVEAEEEENK